jgi:hypothetical protein
MSKHKVVMACAVTGSIRTPSIMGLEAASPEDAAQCSSSKTATA